MSGKCGKCSVDLAGVDLVAKCVECSSVFHPSCTRTANFTKSKSRSWKCDGCHSEASSVKSGEDASSVLLEAINSVNTNLDKKISEVTASISNLTKQFEQLNNKIGVIEDKQTQLSERCEVLEKENQQMKKDLEHLQQQVRGAEQHARCANIEVTGLPRTQNEDVYDCLMKIAAVIGVPFSRDDISMAHRLRLFSDRHTYPPIVAQFVSRRVRDSWIAAAKKKRGFQSTDVAASLPPSTVYINEQLTPYNKALLGRARALVRGRKIVSATYNNGKILVRVSAGSDISQVLSLEQLDRFN